MAAAAAARAFSNPLLHLLQALRCATLVWLLCFQSTAAVLRLIDMKHTAGHAGFCMPVFEHWPGMEYRDAQVDFVVVGGLCTRLRPVWNVLSSSADSAWTVHATLNNPFTVAV